MQANQTRPARAGVVSALALSLLAGAVALTPALPTAPAQAQSSRRDAQAEAFVNTQAARALQILNRSASQAQKEAEFKRFVDQVADVPRITDFVLGKYRRTITPAQYQQFQAVFREYASNVYETRLDEYKGEQFRVTGSTIRKPGDVVVTSQVLGGQLREPQTVRWRLIRGPAGWRVVDVEVVGVWLAITQQQDFVATVDNAGGNIDVLINQLRTQARRQT